MNSTYSSGLRLRMDYYKALIADDALFAKSVGFYFDGTRCYNLDRADDLAIPVGGSRRGGMLELTGDGGIPDKTARTIIRLLRRWPDAFPDVRFARFDCSIEWGDPFPGRAEDTDENIILARGRHLGYSDEAIFQFIELLRPHKGSPPPEIIIDHVNSVASRAGTLRRAA